MPVSASAGVATLLMGIAILATAGLRESGKQVASIFSKHPLPKSKRAQARDANIERMKSVLEDARAPKVSLVQGSTGSGKTTAFMLNIIMSQKKKGILVVPSNNLVKDAARTVSDIYGESASADDECQTEDFIVIEVNATNTTGWNKRVTAALASRKNVLIVCNSNFFNATMDFWINGNWDIMLDEPGDRSNDMTFPAVARAIWTVQHTPKFRGKLLISSATMPHQIEKMIHGTTQTMTMEKPPNPQGIVYLDEFDPRLTQFESTGDVKPLITSLVKNVVDTVAFISANVSQFVKNLPKDIDADEKALQLKSFTSILLALPGKVEASEANKRLEALRDEMESHGKTVIIVRPDQYDWFQQNFVPDANTIVIIIATGHMLAGMNFIVSHVFLLPIMRLRVQKGINTELVCKIADKQYIKQAAGRGGRIGSSVLYVCCSQQMLDTFPDEAPLPTTGLISMLLMWISHGLTAERFAEFAGFYKNATEQDLVDVFIEMKRMELVDDKQSTLQVTETGRLYNIFHESLTPYQKIRDFLVGDKQFSEHELTTMLIYQQLMEQYGGKSTMFILRSDQSYEASFGDIINALTNAVYFATRERIVLQSVHDVMWHFATHLVWHLCPIDRETGMPILSALSEQHNFYIARRGRAIPSMFKNFCEQMYIDPQVIYQCTKTARDQIHKLLKQQLVAFDTTVTQTPVRDSYGVAQRAKCMIDFQKFIQNDSIVGLSDGTYKLAFRLPGSLDFYVSEAGDVYLVKPGLHDPFPDVIVVKGSVSNPLFASNLAAIPGAPPTVSMVTLAVPFKVQRTDDIFAFLNEGGLPLDAIQSIKAWLSDPTAPTPFQFVSVETALMLQFMTGHQTQVVDNITGAMLRALMGMHMRMETMDVTVQYAIRQLFGQFSTDVILTTLTDTDIALDPYRTLPKYPGLLNIHRSALDNDIDPDNAFATLIVVQQQQSGTKAGFTKQYHVMSSNKDDPRATFAQKLNCQTKFESAETVNERRATIERALRQLESAVEEHNITPVDTSQLKSRPCCALCGMVEPFGKLTYVIVDLGKDSDGKPNGLLVEIYHSTCLHVHVQDPSKGDFSPMHTGCRIFFLRTCVPSVKTIDAQLKSITPIFKMCDDERYNFAVSVLQSRPDFLVENAVQDLDSLTSDEVIELYTKMTAKQQHQQQEIARKQQLEQKRVRDAQLKADAERKKREKAFLDAQKAKQAEAKAPKASNASKPPKKKK